LLTFWVHGWCSPSRINKISPRSNITRTDTISSSVVNPSQFEQSL
jgi:hypothetical protein